LFPEIPNFFAFARFCGDLSDIFSFSVEILSIGEENQASFGIDAAEKNP
jgi:hypothetical protein